VVEVFNRLGLEGLIAIGGDGTLAIAHKFYLRGIPIVGVPKTIDNDIVGTTNCFGFDTAVAFATDAIDRLHTTAESHDRVLVCEVMGRHAGHIALHAGIAGGAAEILVPEEPFDVDEVCDRIKRRHSGGRYASIVVVAEGAVPADGGNIVQGTELDAFGHVKLGGIGTWLAAQIEDRTGFETRVTILGHIQRGGTPTAYDRVLSTRFGISAIDAVHGGDFGKMVALRADRIVRVPLTEATAELKTIDRDLYHGVAEVFFG
jgi:6-phosphofructokinase 1